MVSPKSGACEMSQSSNSIIILQKSNPLGNSNRQNLQHIIWQCRHFPRLGAAQAKSHPPATSCLALSWNLAEWCRVFAISGFLCFHYLIAELFAIFLWCCFGLKRVEPSLKLESCRWQVAQVFVTMVMERPAKQVGLEYVAIDVSMEQTAPLCRIRAGYNEVPVPVRNTLLGQVPCGVCLCRGRNHCQNISSKQASWQMLRNLALGATLPFKSQANSWMNFCYHLDFVAFRFRRYREDGLGQFHDGVHFSLLYLCMQAQS